MICRFYGFSDFIYLFNVIKCWFMQHCTELTDPQRGLKGSLSSQAQSKCLGQSTISGTILKSQRTGTHSDLLTQVLVEKISLIHYLWNTLQLVLWMAGSSISSDFVNDADTADVKAISVPSVSLIKYSKR